MLAPSSLQNPSKALTWVLALLAASVMGGVHAADVEPTNFLMEMDQVLPAQQQAYEAGIQKYNQCLSQNGFPLARNAWAQETGKLFAYTYMSGPAIWKDFDTILAAEKACLSVKQSDVNPYLESENRRFWNLSPDLSNLSKDMMTAVPPMMEFKYFTLKSGIKPYTDFTDDLAEFTVAEKKSTWPGHYMMLSNTDNDDGEPDFIIIREYQSIADLGEKIDLFYPQYLAMLQRQLGKAKVASMLKDINEAVVNSYYELDSYQPELSIAHN